MGLRPSRIVVFRGPGNLRAMWMLALIVVIAVLCFLSITIGNRSVAWADIVAGVSGETGTISQAAVARRVPRTVLAAIAGAALGLSGVIMQGITRNPLADPGILGVNAGAALAVVIGIASFDMTSATAFIWVAICGAAVTATFVYTIGSLGVGGATPLKLALAGAATSVAFSSLITGIVLSRNDIAGGIRDWHIGGVGGASFERIAQVLPFLAVGAAIALISARKINVLSLGDETAAGLGERIAISRGFSALGAIMLCGGTTAICGPIGFVGLVVPHFCRLLVGVDHRWLLPVSGLAGAGLLIGSDILGRIVVRPTEMEVGIITALIGAPFFIWIVRRQKVRAL
ncbi:iron complex transport system permease protein [Aliiroseovarius halocynthiae]|uniref:Iron ABC transporter permease n=1 Tax=Aliiroseovarius halocynthiae TaxID=985055 RepID=A0A545SNH3_9RHOB|nr:iron ABC transporter permease [Aliiroseovarius halocynthiae]TQV66533.1 iron ABC transporter permease [Aliiroseovarius halocynthiae]SMR82598.1 iron complex transport system permease protein [Aliiroseovarius halocynthiae]